MPKKKEEKPKKEAKKPLKKVSAPRPGKEKEAKKTEVAPMITQIKEQPSEEQAAPATPAPAEGAEPKIPIRKYFYAVGRRKESIATVRLLTRGSGQVVVNGKPFEQYFPYFEWREKAISPLFAIGQAKNLDTEVRVLGGGIIGQAEAMRHAIAHALLKLNPIFRKSLRKNGFLTRDPRMKERKKYGLKRARRAPQWSKR